MGADAIAERLDEDILAFIQRGVKQPSDEKGFNDLALRVFAYQFERNSIYQHFCTGRGVTPDKLSDWQQVPPVPTTAFKELPLACFPIEQSAVVYHSSGTTANKPSKHYLQSLELYDASLRVNFTACVLPEGARMPMLILAPSARLQPQSSLSHMLEVVKADFGLPGSDFYMDEGGLQLERLKQALRDAGRAPQPVCILGTAFAFVHFLDHCGREGLRYSLPPGSRIMDTGGYKGRSREVPKAELQGLYRTLLGIPPDYVVNEYGMTELGTQFYDNTLVHKGQEPRRKLTPPWARTVVVDPETLHPVPMGGPGLLRHFDLANRGSAMAIQTDDLGVEIGDGFEVLGRASGAEARGCSIAIDEMLSHAG